MLSAVTFHSLFSYESFILRRSLVYTKHHKYCCHATLCYLHVSAGAAPVQLSVHVFQDRTRRTRCDRGSPKSSSQQKKEVCPTLMSVLNEKVRRRNRSMCTHVAWRLFLPACRATPQTHQADVFRMDPVWMKNASLLFTYSRRRKIFLQRRPLETRRSHARRPVTTVPTRFSIKQANNTIPTPINK